MSEISKKSIVKISIIIPVYNVEPYIADCLQSVIRQTYTGEIECIIVDDCGTDRSIEIAEQIFEGYTIENQKSKIDNPISFHILHHDHNRGLSAARNTGTDAATGDYIYYLDSDDEITPNCIELLVEQVTLHPGIQCVQGSTKAIPSNTYYDTACFMSNQYVKDNLWIRNQYYSIGKTIPVNAWNKLLNREFILNHKLYFYEGILHEDQHWIYYLVKDLQELAFVFEPTYIHYNNANSIMSTLTAKRMAQNFKIIIYDWLEHYDEISGLSQIQIILMRYFRHEIYRVSTTQEDKMFLQKIKGFLRNGKQYKSLFYLCLWKILLPIHNFRKFARLSYETIKTE